MFLILKNKIIISIIFIIIANIIFNYNLLINLNYLESDFSLLVNKWFLGQYLFSYDVEFVKRGFVASLLKLFNLDINLKIIYFFCLTVFNILILLFFLLIQKLEYLKISIFLLAIFLFSPFGIISFSNDIGRLDPMIYCLLIILILINLKNKNELLFTIPISVISILIHEISFFIIFPMILLLKFEIIPKNNQNEKLILYSISNILTYLFIFFFGEASNENADFIFKKVLEINDTSMNTILYFSTGIYDANRVYVQPSLFRNIYNLNIAILLFYVLINFLSIYKIFKRYILFDKSFFNILKISSIFLLIFVLYYLIIINFDQICELIFKKNPNGVPFIRSIVLKLSFIILISIYAYILYIYGFKKFLNNISISKNTLLFLSPLILFLTYFVGSDYARYTSLILLNLLLVSIYFFYRFDPKTLNLRYLNFLFIFNFLIFIFYFLHVEKFERNTIFFQ